MTGKNPFCGTWVSSLPFDSDDYLVKYEISENGKSLSIEASDMQDGEPMIISDIRYDGDTLEFNSLMASTQRKGRNKFRLVDGNTIESEYTFTVIENLRRIGS